MCNCISNHILISSYLFGSFYLFSTSLSLTNLALLENKKIPIRLFVLNGLTMATSGYIILYNFNLLCKSSFTLSIIFTPLFKS